MNYFKTSLLFCLLLPLTGCHHHEGENHGHNHEEGHKHNESLQFVSYDKQYETFIVATPFNTEEPSQLTIHITQLSNFKPIEKGCATVSLISSKDTILTQPVELEQPGIFKCGIAPKSQGEAQLLFSYTDSVNTTFSKFDVVIFDDEHEANEYVKEQEITGDNTVPFPKEKSWNVNFSTEVCELNHFGPAIRTMGYVQPSAGDEALIIAKTSGIVSYDNNLTEGKQVSAGQALLSIINSSMADNNLSVRLQELSAEYEAAKSDYERKLPLAEEKIVSQSDLLQAKNRYDIAKVQYESVKNNFSHNGQKVTAPKSGFITQLLVRNGEFVEAGQTIASISQNKDLQIVAEVNPIHYPSLASISDANFLIESEDKTYSLRELNGKVLSYGKSINPKTPLIPVVFQVRNTKSLIPGSFVEMYIKSSSTEKMITIPNEALVEEMGNYFVYVQLTPELFEKREVQKGKSDGRQTAILSGLTEGERVVCKGSSLVRLTQAAGTVDAHSGHVH